jgi:hypothetical protein
VKGAISFFDWLRRWRDRVVMKPFELQEFSALLQVKELGGFAEELERLDAAREKPQARVLGLHAFRLVLFAPTECNGEGEELPAGAPRALLVSLVFDGNIDDVLADLFDAAPDLKWILCRCHGFDSGGHSNGHFIRRLRHHRLHGGYLFRDFAQERAPTPGAFDGDASRAEIDEAFALLRRLERFHAAHPRPHSIGELREAFAREFGEAAFPLPLTPLERGVPGEGRWARRAAEEMGRRQASAARRSDHVSRRAAHAKTIGALHATFKVEALPPEYRQGIFNEPREFPALIRLSNASADVKADGDPDARGLAISVELPEAPGSDDELARARPSGAGARQDFVLFSHPTFFASSVRRFVMLLGILRAQDRWVAFWSGVFFLLSRSSLQELVAGIGAQSLRLRHSLVTEYHSGTAYRFGPKFVAKYSVMATNPGRFEQLRAESSPNFLQQALSRSLDGGPIDLEFYVRLLPVDQAPAASRSVVDLVEDPSFDWDDYGAEKVHVATLTIAPDALTTVDPGAAEHLSFNVWNALAAHRPLGSLNRARWFAYSLSARRRGAERPLASPPGGTTPDQERSVVPDAAE